MYLTLKWLHILCSVVAFGGSLTYGVWAALGAQAPAHHAFALRGIQLLDTWVANPAFAAAGLTGLGLVWLGGLPWALAWVWGSLLLFAFTSALAFGVYQPLLKRQIAAFDRGGAADHDYLRLTRQGIRLGWAFNAANLGIFALMVFKPTGQ